MAEIVKNLGEDTIELPQVTAPSITADKLYNVGGALTFGGTNISAGGAFTSLVEDTSPQLGGNLDVNDFVIVSKPAAGAGDAGGALNLTAADGGATANGGPITIQAGDAGAGSGYRDGGAINLTGGSRTAADYGDGGSVILTGGNANYIFSSGGNVELKGGDNTYSGSGSYAGAINLNGGDGYRGGNINITGGDASSQQSGSVTIRGGSGGNGSGDVSMFGGIGTTGTSPGDASFGGGSTGAAGTSPGGFARVTGGTGNGSQAAGPVQIRGGIGGTTGAGGDVEIDSGPGGATSGDAGDIVITPGAAAGSGSAGAIIVSQTTAPTVTTNKLYNVAGALTWNGIDLTADIGAFTNDASNNLYGGTDAAAVIEAGALSNVIAGHLAGNRLTTGNSNVFVGAAAGRQQVTANLNIAIGSNAMGTSSGAGTGVDNIAIGQAAMSNAVMTTAQDNIAIGVGAMNGIISGDSNVSIGAQAGDFITTGDNNVSIGHEAGPTSNQTDRLYINNASSDTPMIGGNFANGLVELSGAIRLTERADHIGTPTATFGEIWLDDAVPNKLMFTDDAGTDWVVNTASGGDVTKVGTPVNNQIGVWTGDGTIEGTAAITYDGTELLTTGINRISSATPTLRFNETDGVATTRNWAWRVSGNQFTMALGSDDSWTSTTNVMFFNRTAQNLDLMQVSADSFYMSHAGGTFVLQEAASSAVGNVAGRGKVWVRNDVPNNLIFTNDAGTDFVIGGALDPSLTSVAVSDLDNGTDGELITWNSSGVAATVPVGTATHVLTSNGVGAAPTFQAAAGGGTPGGADTEMQYNNGGALGGISEFTFDDGAITGDQFTLTPLAGLTSGSILDITNNLSTKTGDLVRIENNSTSSICGLLSMNNDSNVSRTINILTGATAAQSLNITHNPDTINAVDINDNSTTAIGLRVNGASTKTTGHLAAFYNNGSGMTGALVEIQQDHASSSAPALSILTDGTGAAITISGGEIQAAAGTTAYPSINIAEGVAPSSPVDGDVWVTAAGAFNARLNGSTVDLAGGGSGDVTKVGTPVDNQIGIWTGDGTIEGSASLTYDVSTFTLGFGSNYSLSGSNTTRSTLASGATGVLQLQFIDGTDAIMGNVVARTTGTGKVGFADAGGADTYMTFNDGDHIWSTDGATEIMRLNRIAAGDGTLQVSGGIRLTERADHSLTPAATFGEIWLDDAAPNKLMFTDDAGTDFDLTATGGGATYTYTLQAGTSYTAVAGDFVVASNTGTVTITLPSGHSVNDTLIVKKTGATGTVTVDGNASETIDGALTFVMSTQYQSVTLISDGTNWLIV